MDLIKIVGIFAGGACAGIFAAVVIFVVVAWHSRPQERADRPEAGSKRAKR